LSGSDDHDSVYAVDVSDQRTTQQRAWRGHTGVDEAMLFAGLAIVPFPVQLIVTSLAIPLSQLPTHDQVKSTENTSQTSGYTRSSSM